VIGSCFSEGSSTRTIWPRPAPPSPQAFYLSDELPASLLKLMAAFKSRSSTTPQIPCGLQQRNVRSESRKSSSTQPQPEQVLLLGSHRSASTTQLPYQAANITQFYQFRLSLECCMAASDCLAPAS
jgi:hypothetical protein